MLLANYQAQNSNPGRSVGGVTDPTYFFKAGTFANFFLGDSSVSGQTEKSSFFLSAGAHYTFCFAPKSGGLSSKQMSKLVLSEAASIAGGLPGSGTSPITFTESATGGLIVSGSGTSSIVFSASGTIRAIRNAGGTSSIVFSGSADLGAEANASGSSSITLSGSLALKAIGYLAGNTADDNALTPAALARAVWDALASESNAAGTMGEKLNDAGAAGNPWAALLEDNDGEGTFGERVQKLLTVSKFIGLK